MPSTFPSKIAEFFIDVFVESIFKAVTASIFVATAKFFGKNCEICCCRCCCSYSVFNKPVSCQDGHSFCHHCITQWPSNNNHCPVDRRVLSDTLVRNLAVEGAISRRVIKCPSTISLPGGCSWTGPTAGLENHLHCNMKIMECNFKGRGYILRSYQRELAQHLLICPHRTEKCPSCGVDVPHSNQSVHDELCVGKLVPCPNNCGIQVER